MEYVVLVGRILFGAIFVVGALGHLTKTDDMAAYAAAKGIPFPKLAVLGSGVWQLAGALMVMVGAWPDLGALMIAAFVLPTAVLMHPFWKESDPAARSAESLHFHKDVSLGGAALALFALFVIHGCCNIGPHLTDALFSAGTAVCHMTGAA